jgi:hypothetical protein
MRIPVGILLLCLAVPAFAGNVPKAEVIYNFKQLATLSKGVERMLASRRVAVALIARAGLPADVLPPGIEYSHTGFAVYSRIRTGDGRLVPGYAIYSLYQRGEHTGESFLAQDYPIDYYATSRVLKAGIVILDRKLQAALLDTIFSDTYPKLHNPVYSAISNPFNTSYQNCTEFVVDVMFAAIYRTGDERRIKSNVRAYFQPHPIEVDAFKLALADRMLADIRTDDHDGPITTATFESIARFLLRYGLAEEAFSFAVEPTTLYGEKAKLNL